MPGRMIAEAMLISVATAAASHFITQASILDKPRFWIVKHSGFFGGLITCGYCLSHWIAAVLVAACHTRLFPLWRPLDYLLTILAIAWTASMLYAAGTLLWDAISQEEKE